MDWAVAYLVAGAVWLLLMRLWAALFVKDPSPLVAAARQATGTSTRKTPWKERLEDAALMTAAAMIAWLLWPALMGLMVVSRVSRLLRWPGGGFDWTKLGETSAGGTTRERKRYPFRCRRRHCIRQVSVPQVEQQALIHDPLGRVPQVPFGHLNVAWQRLLEALEQHHAAGATLWYFEAPPKDVLADKFESGPPCVYGYAVVLGRKVVADFVVASGSVKR